jgi:peptide/nickel transport system substrate-binding protein
MEKKQQIVIGVIVVVAVAGIGGGAAVYANMPKGGTFIFGVMYGPVDLDTIQAWDSGSIDVQRQVGEGLVALDVRDPEYPVVPNLATSWTWDADGAGIVFTLRQGVNFHDGTPFNAEAAKWNFDRLMNQLHTIQIEELWTLPSGEPIIDTVTAVDEYTLRIDMNGPYAPFMGLLASWSGYMLSPTAHADNWDTLIDTATGDLVATGPFIYDSYEAGVEVLFSVNTEYWGGAPALDGLIFSEITDSDARHAALLTGDINLIDATEFAHQEQFNAEPNLMSWERPPSTTTQYLGMNNKQIPVGMRKAMTYAFDYDYLIEEIAQGYAVRLLSPIPEGVLYHDVEGITIPELDIVTARQALLDADWPGTEGLTANDDVSEGNAWASLVDDGTPLASYNYTYNIGNSVREDMLILIQANFKQIGVDITDAGMTWGEFIYRTYEVGALHRDMLQIYWLGWIPDYNDPSNFINPLMTNKAVGSNGCQIDDDTFQAMFEAAVVETDPTERAVQYKEIQRYFIEVLYSWVLGYQARANAHTSPNVRGYYPNPFEDPHCKYIYFV